MKSFAAAAFALALSACALAPFRPSPQQVGWCTDYRKVEHDASPAAAVRRLDLLYAARDWPVAIWSSCGRTPETGWRQADLDATAILDNVRDAPWPLRLAGWWFAGHDDWKRSAEARCRARELDPSYAVELLCADSLRRAGEVRGAVDGYRAAYWKAASRDERARVLTAIDEASPNPDADLEGIPPAVVAEWREERAREHEAAEQERALALRQNAERQRRDELAARQKKLCEAQCQANEERCEAVGIDHTRCAKEVHACLTGCTGY